MGHQKGMLVFLGSRIASASMNLLAVAIFTRLAGVESYGTYLLVFAWSFVINEILTSWMNAAFFAQQREAVFAQYLSTTMWMKLLALALVSAPMAAAAWYGLLSPGFAAALGLMVAGFAAHDFAVEATRVRLHAGLSAATTLLRALMVVILGTVALFLWDDPLALPLAVAVAYLCSAAPMVVAYRHHLSEYFRREIAIELFRYGWPLMLAGGTWAMAQNVDRLLMAHFHGSASMGPYGAIVDFLKQGFFVFGEVVVLSLVTVAKRAVSEGRQADATRALCEAMRSIMVITVFGSILVLRLQDIIIPIFLGPEFHATAKELLPLLLLASSILVFRTHYFGQIAYFLPSSVVQLYASVLQLAVTVAVSLALVPTYREYGAAVALVAGQFAACLVVALWRSPTYRLPIPFFDLLTIVAIGLAVWLMHLALEHLFGNGPLEVAADIMLVAVTAAVVLWFYDLFAARLVVRHVLAFTR